MALFQPPAPNLFSHSCLQRQHPWYLGYGAFRSLETVLTVFPMAGSPSFPRRLLTCQAPRDIPFMGTTSLKSISTEMPLASIWKNSLTKNDTRTVDSGVRKQKRTWDSDPRACHDWGSANKSPTFFNQDLVCFQNLKPKNKALSQHTANQNRLTSPVWRVSVWREGSQRSEFLLKPVDQTDTTLFKLIRWCSICKMLPGTDKAWLSSLFQVLATSWSHAPTL